MSLVGPRPERPHFVRQFSQAVPGYAGRQRMPAGLTGWAQVHRLNGDTSISDRARFDNYYIEYWSFWLDLVVLARTVTSIAAEAAGEPPARAIRSYAVHWRLTMKVLHVITGLGVGGAELQLRSILQHTRHDSPRSSRCTTRGRSRT